MPCTKHGVQGWQQDSCPFTFDASFSSSSAAWMLYSIPGDFLTFHLQKRRKRRSHISWSRGLITRGFFFATLGFGNFRSKPCAMNYQPSQRRVRIRKSVQTNKTHGGVLLPVGNLLWCMHVPSDSGERGRIPARPSADHCFGACGTICRQGHAQTTYTTAPTTRTHTRTMAITTEATKPPSSSDPPACLPVFQINKNPAFQRTASI